MNEFKTIQPIETTVRAPRRVTTRNARIAGAVLMAAAMLPASVAHADTQSQPITPGNIITIGNPGEVCGVQVAGIITSAVDNKPVQNFEPDANDNPYSSAFGRAPMTVEPAGEGKYICGPVSLVAPIAAQWTEDAAQSGRRILPRAFVGLDNNTDTAPAAQAPVATAVPTMIPNPANSVIKPIGSPDAVQTGSQIKSEPTTSNISRPTKPTSGECSKPEDRATQDGDNYFLECHYPPASIVTVGNGDVVVGDVRANGKNLYDQDVKGMDKTSSHTGLVVGITKDGTVIETDKWPLVVLRHVQGNTADLVHRQAVEMQDWHQKNEDPTFVVKELSFP